MLVILVGRCWISLSNFQIKDYVNPSEGFFLKKRMKNIRKAQYIKLLKRFMMLPVVPQWARIK
jgi:hypothetical protein